MVRKYDLTVAYRIYPKISGSPAVFGNDKYKLSELCLKSFKHSIGDLKVKMFVLLDDCPSEYKDLFLKYFDEEDLDFIELNGIGNKSTFSLQIKLLLKQNFSEIIYFAEDDYFYLPNQFSDMIYFLKEKKDVDFVSPYNHLDYYTNTIHEYKNSIKLSKNRHWRTAGSTCLTFLTTKNILQRTKNIFLTYEKGNTDLGLWLSITKYNWNNPKIMIKSWKNLFTLKSFYKSLLYNKYQIFRGKSWTLWVPIPSIATHLEKKYLSPSHDWDEIMKIYINELETI